MMVLSTREDSQRFDPRCQGRGLQPEQFRSAPRARNLAVRATGTHLGHGLEPQFPANIALAVAALRAGKLFAPGDASETPMDGDLKQVAVTSIGHWRGEGIALIEAIG